MKELVKPFSIALAVLAAVALICLYATWLLIPVLGGGAAYGTHVLTGGNKWATFRMGLIGTAAGIGFCIAAYC